MLPREMIEGHHLLGNGQSLCRDYECARMKLSVPRRIVGPIETSWSVDAERDGEGPGIAGL